MSCKKGLVSIIVPVYNSDPILMKKCFDSIDAQTYQKIEILVIDDGSSRGDTKEFLEGLKKNRKRRIFVISKKNGGVSSARNLGIEKANGEYVFFLDSDDKIDNEAIGKLVSALKKSGGVASVLHTVEVVDNHEMPRKPIGLELIDINNALDFATVMKNTIDFVSHGALIKRSIAKKYSFDEEIKYGEDFQYMLKVLEEGQVGLVKDACYFYYENTNGALRKASINEADKYVSDFHKIYEEILSRHPDEERIIQLMMYEKINTILKRLLIYGDTMSMTEYIKKIKAYSENKFTDKIPQLTNRLSQRVLTYLLYTKKYRMHYCAMKISCLMRRHA